MRKGEERIILLLQRQGGGEVLVAFTVKASAAAGTPKVK
jgi:hypothetical protein